MKRTFRGGVHPLHQENEGKLPTAALPVRAFDAPVVKIPVGMHLGPPSSPCVKKGDHVALGQVIAEPVGALGLPVHASVSGEVLSIQDSIQFTSVPITCITIQNDLTDTWVEGITPLGDVESVDPSLIVPAIKNAGICGMGGASFPTHIKLTIGEGKSCDTIILNGAECETYLTADHRLMLENPTGIVDGLRAVMRALNVGRGVIAIEDNKPDAIRSMRAAAEGREGVEIVVLKTKYPQGGEKQLIQAVTKRQVPQGKLPLDVHVIVLNVGTAAAIAEAITTGKPVTRRITTVTGCVKQPSNLLLRIGTPLQSAIDACGGFSEQPGKLAVGGGMTGICAPGTDVSITKANNGIVAYTQKQAAAIEEQPCIRCGRCVQVCPNGLQPYLLRKFCDKHDRQGAQQANVLACTVCGCCTYTCPAHRELTSAFKDMKDQIAQAARRK